MQDIPKAAAKKHCSPRPLPMMKVSGRAPAMRDECERAASITRRNPGNQTEPKEDAAPSRFCDSPKTATDSRRNGTYRFFNNPEPTKAVSTVTSRKGRNTQGTTGPRHKPGFLRLQRSNRCQGNRKLPASSKLISVKQFNSKGNPLEPKP